MATEHVRRVRNKEVLNTGYFTVDGQSGYGTYEVINGTSIEYYWNKKFQRATSWKQVERHIKSQLKKIHITDITVMM